MNDAFYDFEWPVAARYEWQDWLDKNGKPITVPAKGLASLQSASAVQLLWDRSQDPKAEYGPVLRPLMSDGSEPRRYRPMQREHAALFREFAGLDYASPAAVLAFAQRYGVLGVSTQSQTARVRGADGELEHRHAYGEPFLRWALEICLMSEGLKLAGRKRSFDMTHRLKWLFDRHLRDVQGRLAFDRAGEPKLALEPRSLIAAMWLQLALAITGEKRFVACKFCQRMFEISTEQTGFRSHREFCRASCKTMDYRKRRRTALRLAATGASLQEISEKTATETATLRSWVAATKRPARAAKTGRN